MPGGPHRSMPAMTWLGAAAFAVILAAPERPALGEWQDLRAVGLFQLRSEFRLGDQPGRELLDEMVRLQVDVERMLNLDAGSKPIEVNLFRTKASYQSYVRLRVPEGAGRPALFVRGKDMGRVYVYRRWGFEQDLRHECTHAILHNALPYVPLWLDEGLAGYFEVSGQQRPSGNPHLAELKRRALFGWRPDLKRLESLSSLTEMNGGHYRESWAWVHWMLHGPPEVRQVLSDYLYDIANGNLAGKLSERLEAVVPHMEAKLISHIRQWR